MKNHDENKPNDLLYLKMLKCKKNQMIDSIFDRLTSRSHDFFIFKIIYLIYISKYDFTMQIFSNKTNNVYLKNIRIFFQNNLIS